MLRQPTNAYPRMTTAHSSQPAHSGMFLFMMASSSSLRSRMVPPSLMIRSMTPCRARNIASVTTKDGMPRRATRTPMSRPITVPVSRPRTSATGHAMPHDAMATASTAAAVPAVKPADRSISPSSRTNTSPIARTMIAADWFSRLAKLKIEKKVSGFIRVKKPNRTIRPRTAGSEPTSPPLTRVK